MNAIQARVRRIPRLLGGRILNEAGWHCYRGERPSTDDDAAAIAVGDPLGDSGRVPLTSPEFALVAAFLGTR